MPRTSNAAKVQEWVDRLARFQGSGLTAAKFCQAEGVSLPSFYQWKRKLTAPTNPAPGATAARISGPADPRGPGRRTVTYPKWLRNAATTCS